MNETAQKEFQEVEQLMTWNIKGARQKLKEILEEYRHEDDTCELAWWYLAHVGETAKERFECAWKVFDKRREDDNALNKLEDASKELLQEAEKKIEENKFIEARALLEKIIKVDPHNEEALRLLSKPEPASQLDPPQPKKRKMLKWNDHPFRDEQQILDDFLGHVDKLFKVAEKIEPIPQKLKRDLEYSQGQHKKCIEDPEQSTSAFLAPAVKAATEIAELLLDSGRPKDAFLTANIFAEMCKVLVARNRQRYREFYKRLLSAACCAVADTISTDFSRSKTDGETADLKLLRKRIDYNCLAPAMRRFFSKKDTKFLINKIADVLREQVMNESLARCFDKRFEHLLKYNHPQLEGYVLKNMPVVYGLKLSGQWDEKRNNWKNRLKEEGHEDVLRKLEEAGLLVNPEKVGKVTGEQREKIASADANNDYKRIDEIVAKNAGDLVSFLYQEAQKKLQYKEPAQPGFRMNKLKNQFNKAGKLARSNRQNDLLKAIEIIKELSVEEIDNLELHDWLAYLYIKANSLALAEQVLDNIRKRLNNSKHRFITSWNLAVVAYRRNDERKAYDLLLPLLQAGKADADLITVLLALSHKLDDKEEFLAIVPHTMGRQFAPLAFAVAHELGDRRAQNAFLGELLKRSDWKLPPVGTQYANLKALEKDVNRAIVEGQLDQVVSWLEARINSGHYWPYNYIQLARVLERHCGDIDKAFRVMSDQLEQEMNRNKTEYIEIASRKLLEFCKRNNRQVLGERAYKQVDRAGVSAALLRSFQDFAPEADPNAKAKQPKEEPIPSPQKSNQKLETPDPLPAIDPSVAKRAPQAVAPEIANSVVSGKSGIFIDHENLIKSLERISKARGVQVPNGKHKVEWLAARLGSLLTEAKKRIGHPDYKVTVAFWNRPHEAELLLAYDKHGFTPSLPGSETGKSENAADFKVIDEVYRAKEQATREQTKLNKVIIVSGDADFATTFRTLANEGNIVQIWSGSEELGRKYAKIVGEDNIVKIDDVCGL